MGDFAQMTTERPPIEALEATLLEYKQLCGNQEMELRKYALRVEALEARLALPLPEQVAKLIADARSKYQRAPIYGYEINQMADALESTARRNAELERALETFECECGEGAIDELGNPRDLDHHDYHCPYRKARKALAAPGAKP
jgi:hypothetical protein